MAEDYLKNLVYCGGSSLREATTFFTAVFYLLGKCARIPHVLLIFNVFNEFEYAGQRFRTVIPPCFGSNFDLDECLSKEIRKKGVPWDRAVPGFSSWKYQ